MGDPEGKVAACGATTAGPGGAPIDLTTRAGEPSLLFVDPSEGTLSVGFQVTAHHYGYLEVRLCSRSIASVGCFQGSENLLNRTEETSKDDMLPIDPEQPSRYYLGPAGLGWVSQKMFIGDYPATEYVNGVVPIKCECQNGEACFQRAPAFEGQFCIDCAFECGIEDVERKPAASIGDTHEWKVHVPRALRDSCGDHCIVQMLYVTANSCNPSGTATYFNRSDVRTRIRSLGDEPVDERWNPDWSNPEAWYSDLSAQCTDVQVSMEVWGNGEGGTVPEKFWNCADVQISSTPPPPTPAPTVMPTMDCGTCEACLIPSNGQCFEENESWCNSFSFQWCGPSSRRLDFFV